MNQFRSPSSGLIVNTNEIDILENNLLLLGSGAYRRVYEIDNEFVLKVGYSFCNKNEVRRWENTNSNLLCPVIGYGEDYSWLVMYRAETQKAEYSFLENYTEWREFMKEINNTFGLMDIHEKNIGIWDNKKVVIDYGEKL